jgi:membrane-associated phospholipid phosphatase
MQVHRGREPAVPGVDQRVHSWVMSHRGPGSITIARAVTRCGVTKIVLPALIAVGAVAADGPRDISRRLGSGLLPGGVAATGVYLAIQVSRPVSRARPAVADWAGPAGGPSFPSIHTTAATLFAASAAWALAPQVGAGWPRRGVWAGAVAYAGAVGWSRVWLGMHWPTDVVAGWLFGAAWVGGGSAVLRVLRRRAAGRPSARSRAAG